MTPRSIATYKTANAKYGMEEGWRVPGVRVIISTCLVLRFLSRSGSAILVSERG